MQIQVLPQCKCSLLDASKRYSCPESKTVFPSKICRNWFNETFLESINAAAPPPPTGIPLTAQEQKDRVVVRRRKPVERPAAPSVSTSLLRAVSLLSSSSSLHSTLFSLISPYLDNFSLM